MNLTKTKNDKIKKYTSKSLYKNQYTNINYSNMKAITNCNSVIFLYDVPDSFIENDKIEKSMNVYFDWLFNGYEKEYTDLYNINIQDKNGRYTFQNRRLCFFLPGRWTSDPQRQGNYAKSGRYDGYAFIGGPCDVCVHKAQNPDREF